MSLKILPKRQQVVSQGLQLHQRCLLIDLSKTSMKKCHNLILRWKQISKYWFFPNKFSFYWISSARYSKFQFQKIIFPSSLSLPPGEKKCAFPLGFTWVQPEKIVQPQTGVSNYSPKTENPSSSHGANHSCCGRAESCGQVCRLLLGSLVPRWPWGWPFATHRWMFSWRLCSRAALARGLVRALKTAPFLPLLMFSAVNSFLLRIIASFQEGRVVEGVRRKLMASEDCFHFKGSCNHGLKWKNPRHSSTQFLMISTSLAERESVEMGSIIGAIFFHLHHGDTSE